MSRSLHMLVYGLFFASGATALVYQVVWVRQLTLIFGASFEAVSIVLGSFMGGLALGGIVFGRVAERVKRPLHLYGILEIGVAVFALLLPWLLNLVAWIYVGLARQFDDAGVLINTVRVVMAFIILLLPTFFMGGTLPVLTRFLVRRYGELAGRLAGLYAINTFGAVAGTLLAGFILLRLFGVWNTTLIAVGGNILIGLIAMAVDRKTPALVQSDEGEPEAESPDVAAVRDNIAHRPALRLAFWGTGAAGMGALALEVMWSRTIAVAIGSTTYSYSIMLAAFLVGIAIGSLLHGLFPFKRVSVPVQFGLTMVVIGITTTIVSHFMPHLPEIAFRLNVKIYGGVYGVRGWTTLLLSFLVMLVPCIFMGVAFPLAGQARALLRERYGESVGDLVAMNTLGAILGALVAGFVLIPMIGLQRGMLIASAVYLGYGLLVLSARLGSSEQRRTLGWTAAVCSLGISITLPQIVPSWDRHLLGAFLNNETGLLVDDEGNVDVSHWLNSTNLLYYAEGRGSNVSVTDQEGFRTILINGKVVASDVVLEMQHEYLLGHLPTLLHPDPRSAVIIGLGAGLTLGGVAADEGLERIVLVEIEPAVVGGARMFSDLSDDALDDPRIEIHFQDGRNFLLTSDETFDVITADPIHPWAQGAVYLYTREYFDIIADRLNDGGIICQWLPLYELSEENLRSVVATFAGSFEHVTIWQASSDVMLIGSRQPLQVDLSDLQRRIDQPTVTRQLGRIGLDDPYSFLATFTMDDSAVRAFASAAIINTDDNLYLEFSSPLMIGNKGWVQNTRLFDQQRQSATAVLSNVEPMFKNIEEADALLSKYAASKSVAIHLDMVVQVNRPKYFKQAAETGSAALASTPAHGLLRQALARVLAKEGLSKKRDGNTQKARQLLGDALQVDPGNPTANFWVAFRLMRLKRYDEAVPHLRRALERRPFFPLAEGNLGIALANCDDYAAALPHLEAATRLLPDRIRLHNVHARTLRALGRHAEADAVIARVQALQRAAN